MVLPAVILGEIAADGRADRRREGGGQREHRKPDRLLRLRQHGDTSVNAIGISTPPVKPCKPRIAIISGRSWVKAQATENTANSAAFAIM